MGWTTPGSSSITGPAGTSTPSGTWSVSSVNDADGNLTEGETYKVKIRYWDTSTNTRSNFHSEVKEVTIEAGHNAIEVTLNTLDADPSRIGNGDKIEIARTQGDRDIFFVELASDVTQIVLLRDSYKDMPPNGTLCFAYENVLFITGQTDSSYSGDNNTIDYEGLIYFSNPYKSEPESFYMDNYIPLSDKADKVTAFAQLRDNLLVFTRRMYYTFLRSSGSITVVDGQPGFGALHHRAVAETPYGVAFLNDAGLFLAGGTGIPVKIGEEITGWLSQCSNLNNVTLAYDPCGNRLWVQDTDPSHPEACVGYPVQFPEAPGPMVREGVSPLFRWVTLKDRPTSHFFHVQDVTGVTTDWHFYSMNGNRAYIYREGQSSDSTPYTNNLYPLGSKVVSGTIGVDSVYNALGKRITLTSGTFGNNPHLYIGGVLRVTSGSNEGTISWITNAGELSIFLNDDVGLTDGDSWVIAAIPFEVRFPTITGSNPASPSCRPADRGGQ